MDSLDARSPRKVQRVCDACFGLLDGSIAMDDVPTIQQE